MHHGINDDDNVMSNHVIVIIIYRYQIDDHFEFLNAL